MDYLVSFTDLLFVRCSKYLSSVGLSKRTAVFASFLHVLFSFCFFNLFLSVCCLAGIMEHL